MSYKKLDGREDEPQAAFAGIRTKLLMRPGVEKQLGDFGVDPESASYTQINQAEWRHENEIRACCGGVHPL